MRTREDPRWMKLTVEVITRAIYFAVGAAIAFYFVSFLWPRIGTFRVFELVLIWAFCIGAGVAAAIIVPRILQKRAIEKQGSLEEIRKKSGLPEHHRVGHKTKVVEIPKPPEEKKDTQREE